MVRVSRIAEELAKEVIKEIVKVVGLLKAFGIDKKEVCKIAEEVYDKIEVELGVMEGGK